jgi:hypothetical protein
MTTTDQPEPRKEYILAEYRTLRDEIVNEQRGETTDHFVYHWSLSTTGRDDVLFLIELFTLKKD